MTITRSDVLTRARTGWPMGGVPYSQSTEWADGYRQDCSGFVAMALGITSEPWGGPNTAQLVTAGYVHSIAVDDLKAGDLIGRLGPGTEGDAGHVQVFVSWDNDVPGDNGHTVIEQTGGGSGPHERHYGEWTPGYGAWRYNGITADPAPAPRPRPFPVPSGGGVWGPITGPAWQHGGYYPNERPTVQEIQLALQRAGIDPGPIDGIYGPRTTAAVRSFQARHGLETDGLVGTQTWSGLALYMS